jgi:tetratricopeptide (TPR) repeat protein
MNIRTLNKLVTLFLMVLFIFSGCGPKPIEKESILDTPDNHYRQGHRALDRGDLEAAAEEFDRATALDPDYAGGYVGLGLVEAEKEDYKDALDLVDKGIGKDKEFIDGYIAKGRILVKQRAGDKWLDNAVKQYEKALKIDENNEKALFYLGEAYKNAYDFDTAADYFKDVISIKGDFAAQANSEWELMQKIQRAAPGTRIGKKIALIPEIDRADLAVLFIEELKLLEVLQKKQPKTYDTRFRPPKDPTKMEEQEQEQKLATDIENHWAKNYIEDIIKAEAMGVFPDRTFRPDEKITRANYAMFLQNILIAVTGDQKLATKYIGTPSRFPDINPTHYAYNAICLSVDRGIMQADKMDGSFGLNKTVSGADALLIIRDLQNALRMTF